MLAVAGFLMIIVFMVLIMTKKLAPMLALMNVPILFALGLVSAKWLWLGLNK